MKLVGRMLILVTMSAMSEISAGAKPLFCCPEYAVGESPCSTAFGDLDNDGYADLAVANYEDDTVSILLNGGDESFGVQVTYGVGDGPRSVAIGDLDGDGDGDLAVAIQYDSDVAILLNLGDGTFAPPVAYQTGFYPNSVAIDDHGPGQRLDSLESRRRHVRRTQQVQHRQRASLRGDRRSRWRWVRRSGDL